MKKNIMFQLATPNGIISRVILNPFFDIIHWEIGVAGKAKKEKEILDFTKEFVVP